ncbi:acyltransferase [Uliginosibacterium sp. H3]|uniref:Acyltransferase n=1 Tax=Uliginosibacterium silvisoli TaxID=3114758 RepID=A0ABU6K6J7_9RHOO|nr:acyltransferase [Uliginosibacterium sp. H3]
MSRQIDSLTSLRGIAAWWVVVFHFRDYMWGPGSSWSSWASYGYLAVDLFFVMSGFVIQLRYAEMFERLSFASCLDFMVIRLARIYPLHLFMCVVYLINPLAIHFFSQSGDISMRYDPLQYVLGLFLVQAWGLLPDYGWNVPSWSISVEFAAYLMFPLLCLSLTGPRQRWWGSLGVLLSAALVLALCFSLAGKGSLGAGIYDLGVVRCVGEFTMGMAVCKLVQGAWAGGVRAARWRALASGIGATALFVAGWSAGWKDYFYVPLCFAGLIHALSTYRGMLARALEWKPLLALGVVSYSTYLCHFFIKDWVLFGLVDGSRASALAIAAYLLLTLIASFLLYRFVELPGQRIVKNAWRRSRAQPGEVNP